MMNFDNFIATLKQKFFIVIALVIVASLGLAVEKYFTATPSTHLSGDAYIECLTRLDTDRPSYAVPEDNKFFVASPMEFYRFIDAHRDAFDYQKLNGNWNGLNDAAKVVWLTKHLEIESYEQNVYVFSLNIEASEAHDYDYVKANAGRFLDAYVAFAQRECSKAGIGELVVIDRVELVPESTTVTRRQLVYKHAIIGAVLGLIVGLIIIFGLSKRAATHG